MQFLHHFRLPRKISRLYPILSLVLLINSSALLYAWQSAEIKLEQYSTYAEREKAYKNQIDSLLTIQKNDKAQLELEAQKFSAASAQLTKLEKELSTKQDQLKQASQQLTQQKDQLSQNAAELDKLRARPPLFSFQNEASLPDAASKEADIKSLVTTAYDYIQRLYGTPYLLNSIVITFVDDLDIDGSSGEIVIENGPKGITINIHLTDFHKDNFQDINTVIHEIIHGFHGVAVFETSAIEEGMTVAATDAVMQEMMKDGKIPHFNHLYLMTSDKQYTEWNKSLHVYADNQQFYSYSDVAKVYQLIGTAWYRLYEQDPLVFKKINETYYPKIQQGNKADTATALDAIRASLASVGGESIDTYLATNAAFNPR